MKTDGSVKYVKAFLPLLFAVMTALFPSASAFACTEVYVGAEASSDGTVIIARSNDWQQMMTTRFCVTERVEDHPGRTMPVNDAGDVRAKLPATTFRYTSTPWMQNAFNRQHLEKDAAACTNEYGVAMTMSVSAFSNQEAMDADPFPEDGLTEDTADDLVICQSRTAREAVEILLGMLDRYGSNAANIATIADRGEAWYIEIYTGHQYAAVKLPADKVCVFGNEFTLEYLSDYEEVRTSPGLERLAREKGFARFGGNGELNLYETYSGDGVRTDYSHMRTWIGHRLLAPSAYGDYDAAAFYPLVFAPDRKVSPEEVFTLMRNRYEGTPYSPDETGRPDMRVIGTDTAMSVHVLQIYPKLPAEISVVTWDSLAPDIYGVFVPVSNLCTGVSASYGADQPAEAGEVFDTEHYPWYALKELNTVGLLDERVYGEPVKAFWRRAEQGMRANLPVVLKTAADHLQDDPEGAEAYVTAYCNMLQEQAFADAKSMLNTALWYLNLNSNTLKMARNPETHQISGKRVVPDPIPVDLPVSAYWRSPGYKK